MIKLRWFSKRTHATAEDVRAHAAAKGIVFAQAKHELERRTQPVLQVYSHEVGAWFDVPFVEQVTDPRTGLTNEITKVRL